MICTGNLIQDLLKVFVIPENSRRTTKARHREEEEEGRRAPQAERSRSQKEVGAGKKQTERGNRRTCLVKKVED